MNLFRINKRYPYPQCLITPLLLVLAIVVVELPRQMSWDKTVNAIDVVYATLQDQLFPQQPIEEDTEITQTDFPITTTKQILDRTRNLFGFSKASQTSNNIWDHLRSGFDLTGYEHPRVDAQLEWYARNQSYLDRVTERSAPYIHFILQEVTKRDMPTEIALLPVVESAFQPFAFSSGRAAGIWQFIPETGRLYGLKQNWWYDGRRDIYASTQAALDFLQDLNKHFKGDWLLALAAYNSGQGTVDRARRRNQQDGKPTNFWALDLPKETRDYVPKLLAISALVADPEGYNVTFQPLPHMPYFERVDIAGQIDLAKAAELANISIDELYRLNPAFNRWATAPTGPHYLLVPFENAQLFKTNLETYPIAERIQWKRHIVAANETLNTVARKHGTTAQTLQRINKLPGSQVARGKSLVIPVAPQGLKTYLASLEEKNLDSNLTSNPKQKITHTVTSGDTIWGISQEYNVSMTKVANWNKMDVDDVLIEGKKLVIWANEGVDDPDLIDALIPTTFAELPTRSIRQKLQYRVRDGDSLASISDRFNVSIQQVQSWNNLNKEDIIQPGQSLTLYVDVTRQSDNI